MEINKDNVTYVPDGTLYKYFGEQHTERHPDTLVWPGIDGIPVLGSVKKGAVAFRFTLYSYFKSKTFDLSNPEDEEYYIWVADRISNGWFKLIHREHHWEDGVMKVYVEWQQRYVKADYDKTSLGSKD